MSLIPEVLDAPEAEVKDSSAISVLLEKKSLFADPIAARKAVDALEAEVAKLKEAGIDCSVSDVDKDARLRRRQLISLCTRGDTHRKDMNAPHQRVIDTNNDLWKELEPRIRALVPVFDAPIKAEEARKEAEAKRKADEERQRVSTLKAKVAAITNKPVSLITANSETLAAEIDALEHLDITAEAFEEFAGDATVERETALEALRVLHTNKLQAEANARAAEEARIAKEKADAEAAELAKKQAEQMAELQRQLAEANAAKKKAEDEAAAAIAAASESTRSGGLVVGAEFGEKADEAVTDNQSEGVVVTEFDLAEVIASDGVSLSVRQATYIEPKEESRPPAAEIVKVVADHFDVDSDTAAQWLRNINLTEGF